MEEQTNRWPQEPLRLLQLVVAIAGSLLAARLVWLHSACPDGYLDRLDVRAVLVVWLVSTGALLVGALGETDARRIIAIAGTAGLVGVFLAFAQPLVPFAVAGCCRLPRSPELRFRGLLVAPVSLIVSTGLPFMAMSFMHGSDFIGRC